MENATVVVPARNEQDCVARCLGSLRNQTIGCNELIVVDSASTDKTANIAKSFGARVIRLGEPGIGRARQVGFQAAEGKLIASTDADTVVPPDWLEQLLAPFEEPQVVGVYGALRFEESAQVIQLLQYFFHSWQKINYYSGWPLLCGANFAVRKEAFLGVNGFSRDHGIYENNPEHWLGLKLRGIGEIRFLPELSATTSTRKMRGLKFLSYALHYTEEYLKLRCFGNRYMRDIRFT
jgi:glycosyltransferase involved in cell wall biosynthesis